jgi:hypothetical protein
MGVLGPTLVKSSLFSMIFYAEQADTSSLPVAMTAAMPWLTGWGDSSMVYNARKGCWYYAWHAAPLVAGLSRSFVRPETSVYCQRQEEVAGLKG